MTNPLRPRPPPLPPGSTPLPEALGLLSLAGGASGRSLSKLSGRKLPASSITYMDTGASISSDLPSERPTPHAVQSSVAKR